MSNSVCESIGHNWYECHHLGHDFGPKEFVYTGTLYEIFICRRCDFKSIEVIHK